MTVTKVWRFRLLRSGNWARQEYGGVETSFAKHAEATRGVVPADELRATRRSYAAAISYVDEQIGRILAALVERGELENTLRGDS